MPYTTGTLLGYMEGELGPLLALLGLDTSDALAEGVTEITALLGAAIADVTDDLKLRRLARWQAWLAASNAATNQYDVSLTGGKRFVRSQLWDHIQSRLAQAATEAMIYPEAQDALAGGNTAYVTTVTTGSNPYAYAAEAEL